MQASSQKAIDAQSSEDEEAKPLDRSPHPSETKAPVMRESLHIEVADAAGPTEEEIKEFESFNSKAPFLNFRALPQAVHQG